MGVPFGNYDDSVAFNIYITKSLIFLKWMQVRSSRFNKTFNLDKGELIGEGNFAKVYKIYDEDLKKYVAIRKVVKEEADLEDVAKEKKINEELQKVASSNILEIFEIIETKEFVWYLTEYCSGGSLWDALNEVKNHKFTEVETLHCVLQIAKGVQELHNHRITHRDLKPENILLARKYKKGSPIPDLKIADFGLSTKNIIMETVAGTKEYIAPEQARFQTYTNAVDVWSIGIIFDELLHGEPYYTGENNKEVFDKIIKMEYKVRDQAINESIKTLLVSVLKKKAYERPIIGVLKAKIEDILKESTKSESQVLERPRTPKPDETKFQKANLSRKQSAHRQLPNSEGKQVKQLASSQPTDPEAEIIAELPDLKQHKIPIFKNDKKRAYQMLKRPKKDDLTRTFVPIEDELDKMLLARDQLRGSTLKLQDFTFNPNSKIAPFDISFTPFEKFTELKKEFEYLNEVLYEQAYEIKVMQTEAQIQRAADTIRREVARARGEMAHVFFGQIDSYIDELVAKSIS